MNRHSTFFFLLFAIILAFPTFGQIKKAKKLMDLYNFSEAIPILEKTIRKNDPKTLNE